jgi:hypothetical protein
MTDAATTIIDDTAQVEAAVAQLATLLLQIEQARAAGTQAQLDALHAQAVAAANALAPPGAAVVPDP